MALILASKKNIIFLVKNISIITLSRNMHKSSRRTVNKLLNNNKNIKNNDLRIKRQVKNLNEKRFTMQKSNIRLHRNVKIYSNKKHITDFNIRKKIFQHVETSPLKKWRIHRIKTLCQPFRKKEAETFFDKKFLTEIKQNTKIDDMSVTHLRKEMFLRFLLKEYKNTSVNIQLENNFFTQVGASQTGYKISNLMQAYLEKTWFNNIEILHTIESIAKETNLKEFIDKIYIGIVIPKQREDYFIELAEHKHLLLIKYSEGFHYVFAYLTSKKTSDFFAEKKYKNFENEQNALASSTTEKEKAQHFVLNDPVLQISEDTEKIQIVKYNKEYLACLNETTIKFMKKSLDRTLQVISFKSKILEAQDGLNICKQHDQDVLRNKNKPPLTKEQEKINTKIKEENEQRKKQKAEETQQANNKDQKNIKITETHEYSSIYD